MDLAWTKESPYGERELLAELLNKRGLLDEALEVGVHRAEYAVAFLDIWRGRKFYAVDPWLNGLPDYIDPVNNGDRNDDYAIAMAALGKHSERVEVMRLLSADAAGCFADESLDFVYIDANHAEPFVRQDIELWYPKVKPGGVIAGHDIVNGDMMGVRRAVKDEIFIKHGLDVYMIPGPAWSWYAFKK